MDAKTLTQHVIIEATSGQVIDDLTEGSIDAALGAVNFDTIIQDMPAAKIEYYENIRQDIADRLGIPVPKVGHYITDAMKVAFAKGWENVCKQANEGVEQSEDGEQQDDSPKILTED